MVFDRKNRFLAVGLFDPNSAIRLRILRKGTPVPVGPELFRKRLKEAARRRASLAADPGTTGHRLVHGEADELPGLVLDRYGEGIVLKLYSAIWLPWLGAVAAAVDELFEPRPLVGLVSRRLARDEALPDELREGAVLSGSPDSLPLAFLESGLRFEAHPLLGHKTGFYLDQRENRRRVEELAPEARILNVFSYTGGFSLYAARGGAREVVSVDVSGPALEQAERHFELNRDAVGSAVHRSQQGDAFQLMEQLGEEGQLFEIVVVDPPSFAQKAAQREGALDAYRALTRLALGVLSPGGVLVQASCSSRVPEDPFFAAVHAAARGVGRPLEEMARTGHPVDHPVTFPEGAYLKCLSARVP